MSGIPSGRRVAERSVTRLGRTFGVSGLRLAHIGIGLFVLGLAGLVLAQTYQTEVTRSDAEAERLHDVLAMQLHGNLQASANNLAMLGRLKRAYAADPARVSALLASEIETMEAVRALLMVDPNGRVVGDSRRGSPGIGIDVSDREYFRVHLQDGTPAIFVGLPVQSRVDGAWSLPVSRAIRDHWGRLLGVTVASYSVEELSALFGKAADPHLAVILFRPDGRLLANWPLEPDRLGSKLPENEVLAAVSHGSARGTFAETSTLEGARHRVDFSLVGPFDVVLCVGYDRQDFLLELLWKSAPWLLLVALALLLILGSYLYSSRLYRSMLAEKQAADLANQNKSRILAVASHELRTPLNAIIGFSDVVASDRFGLGLPARYRDYLTDVRSSAQGLLATVNDLLDASQASQGEMRIVKRPCDLVAELQGCVARVRPDADARGQALDAVVPAEPLLLVADAGRLHQVMDNLLRNAVKYAPEGASIRVTLAPGPDTVEIVVADTGRGIPKSLQRNLFSPFSRGNDPMVASSEGSGLGLYIVRRIVELHGGTVSYRDGEPHGATFVVRLPHTGAASGSGETPQAPAPTATAA